MAVRWTRINKRERCLPNNQPKIYSNRPRPTNMSAMASCVTSVAGLHGCAKLHERWRKALRVLRSLIPSHRELLRSKAVVVGEMLSAVGDDDLAAPSFGGQGAPSAIAWRGSGDIIRGRCIKLARCSNGRNRMARRSVPPPKPKFPILTVGQKRRRIARLQKCITSLEIFDSQKVRKRFGNPEVLTLEAAIDKALSSAFGNGTPAYMRFNQAATLDAGPLITNATLRSPDPRPIGGPGRHDLQVQEARQYFSEGKQRSIALLRNAIGTLEDEIANALPIADKQRVVAAAQESKTTHKAGEVPTLSRHVGSDLKAVWGRVGRWWRGRA
jgi:hypothetical protein